METKKEFKDVRELVKQLLLEDERSRNDDKWLTYLVMRHYTKIYIPFEDFDKMPAFETVKRTRAKLQNKEGYCPPTEQSVIDRRSKRRHTIAGLMR